MTRAAEFHSNGSLLLRAATLTPTTADPATRTVRATISTGAAVPRKDQSGTFMEVLDLNGADLSQAVGAPVLDAHRQGSVADVIGVVKAVGRDAAGLWADLQISERAAAIWKDIEVGILRGISIGYAVSEWRQSRDAAGNRVLTAARWRMAEASLVPIPADPGAIVRTGVTMDPEDTTITGTPDPAATTITGTPAPTPAAPVTNTRNAEIRTIGQLAGMDTAWIDSQIDCPAVTVDAVRAAAFQAMGQRAAGGPLNTATTIRITGTQDDPITVRTAMADALVTRLNPAIPLNGKGRDFAHHTALDMLGELLTLRGERVNRHDRLALATRAHTTSDFPLLLADSANKLMLPAYTVAAPTYRRWSAPRSFADFKAHNFLRVGDFPGLSEVKETGETKYGTLSENREQVTAKEYGSGLIIGRKLLINDDMHQLAEFSAMAGTRVAADENTLVYTLLIDNPTMSDAKALFHADHGNLAGSGTDLDVTNLSLAIAAMRKQKSLDGLVLNLVPQFLVVGPDREFKARQLLATIVANQTSSVNPYSGMLELIVDANITTNAWYLFGSPALAPVLVYGYVAGQTGPQMRSEVNFDTGAIKIRVGLDFGYGAVDYRGAYKNNGNS